MIEKSWDPTKPGSKYSLVVAVAKRARQILARKEPLLMEGRKPVTIALEDISQGKYRVVAKETDTAAEENAENNSEN